MNIDTKTLSLLSTLALNGGCFQSTQPLDAMDGEVEMGDDGDEDDGAETVDPPALGMAKVRVIHGAPGAPAVDMYVAGSTDPVVAGVVYGEASAYLKVPAGRYDFEIRATDASPFDAPAYRTGDLDLAEGAVLSALAAGRLGSDGDDAFRVIPLAEDFDDAGAGQAQVRIVHAGSDAPTVSIDVGDDDSAEIQAPSWSRPVT